MSRAQGLVRYVAGDDGASFPSYDVLVCSILDMDNDIGRLPASYAEGLSGKILLPAIFPLGRGHHIFRFSFKPDP